MYDDKNKNQSEQILIGLFTAQSVRHHAIKSFHDSLPGLWIGEHETLAAKTKGSQKRDWVNYRNSTPEMVSPSLEDSCANGLQPSSQVFWWQPHRHGTTQSLLARGRSSVWFCLLIYIFVIHGQVFTPACKCEATKPGLNLYLFIKIYCNATANVMHLCRVLQHNNMLAKYS